VDKESGGAEWPEPSESEEKIRGDPENPFTT